MIKLFLSDLDGTLLDSLLNIHERDLKAIETLQERDIAFGIVTGRDLGFYLKYVRNYFEFNLDYIGNNGATMYVNDMKLYETHLESKEALRIIEYMLPYIEGAYPFVADEGCNFYYVRNKPKNRYWEDCEAHMGEIGPAGSRGLLEYLKSPKHSVVKISFFTKDMDGIRIASILRQAFGDEYEISITAKHFVEVTAKGNDKGTTIQKLLDYLNLDVNEVAVIGDGENDIPMLKMIPNAFVMKSASAEIKQYGRVVDSVAEAIEYILEGKL